MDRFTHILVSDEGKIPGISAGSISYAWDYVQRHA